MAAAGDEHRILKSFRVPEMAEDGASTEPPDRWRHIEEIFHAARQLGGAERRDLLARECGDDEELRREVESLLSFGDDAKTRVGPAVAEAIAAAEPSAAAGDRIGPYRLLRVLGEGGLSTVFLAERDDRQFSMQVAIKVIRQELDSQELRDRLRRERQILADFNHPFIAQLLDGGTTDDGQPYFVLEHIDGQELETYCDARCLSLHQRLELFQKVCSAVEYAHRNLIIHRDLKPANILVTADGIPKLLDFGIAKPIEPLVSLDSMAHTSPHVRLLTPHFASPEQVRGDKLTTATDIYSLGVVLFRLLTGAHPYELEGARASQIERIICEQAPDRPSVAVERLGDQGRQQERIGAGSQRLRRWIAGDLDTIVNKALRKEAERRYSSVQQLREDIHRHLAGLPVLARPDTVAYRLGKYLRRHLLTAATAAGIVLLTVLYTFQLASERNRAQREATKAAQIADFMTRLFKVSGANEAKGETVTARELLDRGAEAFRVELEGQPEVQAAMMEVMADAYRSLGLFRRALPLYEDALAQRQRVLDGDHPDIAKSLNGLGELCSDLGEYDRAKDALQEALELRTRTLGSEHRSTLTTLNNLAAIATLQGDLETAERLFRRVLDLRRETLGPDHSEVATSLNNLADVLSRKGDVETAEGLYRHSLALKRKLKGRLHADVAVTLNNLASLLHSEGEGAQAKALYREALDINQRILEDAHPDITFGLRQLASLATDEGDHVGAFELLREALTIHDRGEASQPAMVASLLERMGDSLLRQGRPEEARALLERAVDLRRRQYPDGDWRLAQAIRRLAAAWLNLGRHDLAEPLAEKAHRELERRLGAEHRRTRAALELLEEIRSP